MSRSLIVGYEDFTETGPLKGDQATVEDFDRLMAVNVRGTMLCYKHAGRQMIAQGRGGRIIGAFPLRPSPIFCRELMSIFRGVFTSGKTGSSLPIALCGDEAHLARTGLDLCSSYSASKFAIRGLTQAAGTPYTNASQ